MTQRRTGSRITGIVVATVLLCACLSAGAARAAGETATLLFFSARSAPMLPTALTELRVAGEATLDSTLTVLGVPGPGRDAIDAVQIRHRVRSGRVIDPDFLAALHDEVGATQLLVVQLLFDAETVHAAGRLLDTDTGFLRDAGTVEPRTWSGGAWRPAVDAVLADLATRLLAAAPATTGSPFVVLPVSARGIAAGDVLTATHTLLETVLVGGGVSIPDPGVVNHLLIEAGFDPRRVDAAGMAALADTLGAERMLVTELSSYDVRSGRSARVYDDGPTQVRSVLPSFFYLARLTDLRSGTLAGCSSLFHDDRVHYGWFGRVSTHSSRRTLGDAARRLWFDLITSTEESHE